MIDWDMAEKDINSMPRAKQQWVKMGSKVPTIWEKYAVVETPNTSKMSMVFLHDGG